jgi:heme/copper-type cytochrome/quinol oxidase subunit 3
MASEGALPRSDLGAEQAPVAREPGIEAPAERRERGIHALSVGARLFAGATTFFFLSFVFAYFYLRSLNQDHFWRPTAAQLKEQQEALHVSLSPNQALGVAFVVCIVVSVALTIIAGRIQGRGGRGWVLPAFGGLVLGLAAVALQCIEFVVQKFGPTDGAFASVFCGWLGFYMLFVVGTMYWLEIHIATELRERRKPPARRPGEGETEYEHPDQLLPRGKEAVVFYWSFLGGIGVLTWVVLYLI